MSYSHTEHLRLLNITATEVCEVIEHELLATGRLKKAYNCNPHHPESHDDIMEFQRLVDIVSTVLERRVYTFVHKGQK